MDILEGLLLINDTDVYTNYGAFLAESDPGKHTNYDALFRGATVKEQAEVSLREENGVRMAPELTLCFEARDVTQQFAIVAPNAATFLRRYAAFIDFLRRGDQGWLNYYLADLRLKFRFYLKAFSDHSQLTDFGGEVAATFSVVFREPEPAFSFVQQPLE